MVRKYKFRSFEDARRFARLLHLHGVEEGDEAEGGEGDEVEKGGG